MSDKLNRRGFLRGLVSLACGGPLIGGCSEETDGGGRFIICRNQTVVCRIGNHKFLVKYDGLDENDSSKFVIRNSYFSMLLPDHCPVSKKERLIGPTKYRIINVSDKQIELEPLRGVGNVK